jgi:8-oxo-dGTP diphosphatase
MTTGTVAEAGFAPLITKRLVLRPYRPDDAAELHRLMNDWQVCCSLAAVPYPYERALADEWVVSSAAALARGQAYHLAVTGRDEGQDLLLGGVGLRIDKGSRVGKLGYWVGRRFWKCGVASEAAGRFVRWALANLDLERIESTVATDNYGSIAVLRHIGFRHVGEGREKFLAINEERPILRFEATREDLFGQPDDAEAAAEPGPKKLVLVAACALVDIEGRILLARRPEGKSMAGLWEFPGGKLDPGETPEAALIRELKEELGIDVSANCLAPFAFASHPYPRFHLLMPLYLCRRWGGTVQGKEGQRLAWVRPEKLAEYPMPEADRPLVPLLRDFL